MVENELVFSEPRIDRTQACFDQASKVFRTEFPSGSADLYRWEYISELKLSEIAQERRKEENLGVLRFASDQSSANLLLPLVEMNIGRAGSDSVRKKVLLPRSTAQMVWALDTGKVANREHASDYQTELFLEASRAMLEDNRDYVAEPVDQDSFSYYFDVYFAGVVRRAEIAGQIEEADVLICSIVDGLRGSRPEEFGVVVSGVRSTVLYRQEPFFTVHDSADMLVQRMIANELLPKFIKRMDQKHIWYRPNARRSGFVVPEFGEDDQLIATCREFGMGSDLKKFIEGYLSGALGKSFYEKVQAPYFAEAEREREEKEKTFLLDMGDEGKMALADVLKNAMTGAAVPDQVDYSVYDSDIQYEAEESAENDDFFEDEPIRVSKKKKVRKEERPLED